MAQRGCFAKRLLRASQPASLLEFQSISFSVVSVKETAARPRPLNDSAARGLNSSRFDSRRQFPAQFVDRNDRLGSIGDLERLKNCSNMIFHRGFGQIECLANRFVILALH